ncbi:MAG: sn-glycerol-3-phosphate ABC transporter ATP-binding protein UgpC [Planctomycetes bacterium]|nr:sn-glycerol-3-phosphate ABC transporter ATP-binding protein UgpC [Planctomycetota bacterium]
MAEVKLEHVFKEYPGQVQAVNDFDLLINNREFLVLVGPSGCGKSTTLRMIAGLEEITKGTISIGERVVNDVPPKDRDIAMVFQNYALYPHMTVYENLAFGLRLRHYPNDEIDRRVQEVARILGLLELLERKPKALSGGQRQRVAVGRAIVRKPAVFLFDEPLSNLDAKLRVEMRAELNKLHHRLKTTMIYVTHDQLEAMTLADRIVVMKDGWIQQVGRPLEIYDYPINAFVAGFIGTPPMNFLHGTLEDRNGTIFWTDGHGAVKLSDDVQSRVRSHVGRKTTFGVRPENIHDKAFHGEVSGETHLLCKVEVVEPLGDEQYVYLSEPRQEHMIIAKFDAHQKVSVGSEMEVLFNLERIHVFDEETGENISRENTQPVASTEKEGN